ncbi:hypothetical protein [Empedobacter stercoris]|uniref:hypothetical protein n=1 Tax=Empedobacter stercoris TaxID=1628248 RepID=UPI0039EAEF94
MKILAKSDNVSKFIMDGLNCYYEKEKNIFKDGEPEIKLDHNFYGEFYINNTNLILQSYYGNFEFKGKKINGYYNYLDEHEVSYINKEDGYLYFETNNEFKKTMINQNILCLYKKYFIFDDKFITRLDALQENSNELWQFELQSIPNNPYDDNYDKQADWQVKKFIGVLENKLWVALNHHTIIALDIESGALLHQLHDILTFKSEWLPSAIPLSESTVIDEKNNKLIGFMWEFYWEINPQNGEITLLDFTDSFLAQKVRNDLQDFVLTDTHIYFASHHDIKVAAFNRQTKQIDWFHEFEDDGNGYQSRISKIDGNDDKLGVLTQGKVLYIFEKDS